MEQTEPSEQEIQDLLKELRNDNGDHAFQRKLAAETIQEKMITDPDVLDALRTLATRDKIKYVREAARTTLISLGVTPPPDPDQPLSNSQKYRRFLGGLLGWYLLNGLAWLYLGNPNTSLNIIANLMIFPINLSVLIILAIVKKTRLVALGILAALGLNFFLSLINGMFFNGICFIPFYLK